MEENKFESKCGVLIAIFAAIMAITDMFGGKYGEEEIKFINEKSSAYMWFQAKSIRGTVTEGQRDMVNALLDNNSIGNASTAKLKTYTEKLTAKINKYDKEKTEILLGSATVGKDNWIQDIDGKLGQVIGAQEYEKKIEVLGSAGDKFDLSSLFLQLCLVMGAISIVVRKPKLQKTFFYIMLGLGITGSLYSVAAMNIAASV